MASNHPQSICGLRSGDSVSFNSNDEVRKLSREGRLKEALQVVKLSEPPVSTYIYLLKECAKRKALTEGKQLHALMVRNKCASNIFSANNLVDMYSKCGSVSDAFKVFARMRKRNVFSWTAMISACVDSGQCEKALYLFCKMLESGITPDKVLFVIALKACAKIAALEQGKQLHSEIRRRGLELDVILQSGLIGMYAKCGCPEDAREVFNSTSERDVVLWTLMIGGLVQNGLSNEALFLYKQMKQERVQPDVLAFAAVLKACASLAALEQGRQLHLDIRRSGLEFDLIVHSALVDMYGKCGCLEEARELFNKKGERDVVTWTAMIGAYGHNGYGKEAVAAYEQMKLEGVQPDEVSCVCVLSACSHSGLIEEGFHVFDSMIKNDAVRPTLEHYACMVDLLCRAGFLARAENLIMTLPMQPDFGVWMSLLVAARNHGHVDIGRRAFNHAVKLEPHDPAPYLLLLNISAAAGRFDEVAKLREEMKHKGLKNLSGCSWIEVDNQVHTFSAGDASHPKTEQILAELDRLVVLMKKAGYEPDLSCAVDVVEEEEEEKERTLCRHSLKLAIAFGLISLPPGTAILIKKNGRVCRDCHNATKFISKIVGGEVSVMDTNRAHRFKDGICSCRDYW